MDRTVSDLGERSLIDRITAAFGTAPEGELWAGDDAASVRAGDDVLVTTDVVVEDVDFRLHYASGGDIGFKAISVSASDIAAMGGTPTHAVVAVALPPDISVTFVDDLAAGMAEAAASCGIGLAGGDISEAREVSITSTVLGTPPPTGPVRRTGSRPGELVCVTGSLGGAGGGLALLEEARRPHGAWVDRLIERHLRPTARCGIGRALAPLATAMIDLSDGLAVDLAHVCAASGVGCDIDTDLLPVDEDLMRMGQVSEVDPVMLAVTGGEDLELLFTVPSERVEAAITAAGVVGCTVIGRITGAEVARIGSEPLEWWRAKGWEHLR